MKNERTALAGADALPCYVSSCGRVTLYLGDSLVIAPTLQGVDALISDPQYQLANGKKADTKNATRGGDNLKGIVTRTKDWGTMKGDDQPYDPTPWLGYPTVILWGAIHYANRLPNSTSWLIWDKREGVKPDDNADCETAWSNIGGPARIHRQLWKGICRRGEENVAIGGDKLHPFQKPVSLMAWCMDLAKVPAGAVVLDPYMGSGSTGVAAIRTGRRFVGIEIDPTHYATALKRITDELAQGDLFLG